GLHGLKENVRPATAARAPDADRIAPLLARLRRPMVADGCSRCRAFLRQRTRVLGLGTPSPGQANPTRAKRRIEAPRMVFVTHCADSQKLNYGQNAELLLKTLYLE